MSERKIEFNANDEYILRENRHQLGEQFAAAERKRDDLMAQALSIQKQLESSTCTNQRAEILYQRLSKIFHSMGDLWTEVQETSSQLTKVEEKTRGFLAGRGLSNEEIQ